MCPVASRKHSPALAFTCLWCPVGSPVVSAPAGDELEVTRLCRVHFDKRFADGMAAQRKADQEAAHG
jgi:hypothetical protein